MGNYSIDQRLYYLNSSLTHDENVKRYTTQFFKFSNKVPFDISWEEIKLIETQTIPEQILYTIESIHKLFQQPNQNYVNKFSIDINDKTITDLKTLDSNTFIWQIRGRCTLNINNQSLQVMDVGDLMYASKGTSYTIDPEMKCSTILIPVGSLL